MRGRVLWVLGTCLAYAGVQLGILGVAAMIDCGNGIYASEEKFCHPQESTPLSEDSLLKLQALSHTAKDKYLGECRSLADLDLYGTNVNLCSEKSAYERVVVRLPYDAEYISKIRNDNTLSNSVGSLLASGIFRVEPAPKDPPLLNIVIDLDYEGSMNIGQLEYRRIVCPSFIFRSVFISDLVDFMCGSLSVDETVNGQLDDLVDLLTEVDKCDVGIIFGAESDKCLTPDGPPRNTILMDFVYLYNKEQAGKIELREGDVLPLDVETSTSSVDHDGMRALNYYVDYFKGDEDEKSAAFYVPHVDGNDVDESLGRFFTVTGLLSDLKRYKGVSTKGTTPFGISVFSSLKEDDYISIVKANPIHRAHEDDSFRKLFEVIWDDSVDLKRYLFGWERDIPYREREGFGGFVVVMPLLDYFSSCGQ